MERWIPEILEILGDHSSTNAPTVWQSQSVVATRRRWQDFVRERDGLRRRIEKEEQANVK